MNQEKIGMFIATCRKEKKLTQQILASRLGVSDKTISNWENGRNMPDLSLFIPLCKELDITVNDLISGERIDKNNFKAKAEENVINSLKYSKEKINTIIKMVFECGFLFGIGLVLISFFIFPNGIGLSLIYILIGIIISTISFWFINKKYFFIKRIIYTIIFLVTSVIITSLIDCYFIVKQREIPKLYIGAMSIEDKVDYYDTFLYDVIICYNSEKNENINIVNNHQYSFKELETYCKKK